MTGIEWHQGATFDVAGAEEVDGEKHIRYSKPASWRCRNFTGVGRLSRLNAARHYSQ